MPTISALPAAPDPNDRSTFNARAYPWSVALSAMTGEINAVLPSIDSAASASAAAIAAANYKGLWSSLTGALAIPASVFHASKVWMLTESVADVTAQVPGVSSKWISLTASAPSITRSARTSNTALGSADKGKLIDVTSGTFTQTFDASATLGDGWWCYLRNSGTGDITLDPNASETIDGLASYVMYPGEVRIIQCDGTALRSVVLNAFSTRTFTASATVSIPPGYQSLSGLLWGGGGGGGGSTGRGGGGGACVPFSVPASFFSATAALVIGAGGAASSDGGTSSLAGASATIYAYGGGGGGNGQRGGGGGGAMSAGTNGAAATPLGGNPANPIPSGTETMRSNHGFGGGHGGDIAQPPGVSMYGGGGGSASASAGGASVYGGGGGGGNSGAAGGTSVYGGAGGAGATGTGVNGIAPGGGGGGGTTTGSSGARGELRIWGVI